MLGVYSELEEEVKSAICGDNIRLKLKGVEEEVKMDDNRTTSTFRISLVVSSYAVRKKRFKLVQLSRLN